MSDDIKSLVLSLIVKLDFNLTKANRLGYISGLFPISFAAIQNSTLGFKGVKWAIDASRGDNIVTMVAVIFFRL